MKETGLTVVHEGVLQLRTREPNRSEVVEHPPRRSGVYEDAEAEVRDAVQEREDVRARLLHREHDRAAVLLRVVAQDRDDEVRVQRVEAPRRLVQQQDNYTYPTLTKIRVIIPLRFTFFAS